MEEIVGTWRNTIYRNEEQDFLTGSIESGEMIVGPADIAPEPGMTYRFFGSWKHSPKYGKQFRYVAFTSHEPHSREAVCNYLERTLKGCGLGKVTCIKLWDAYQSDAVRVLRTQPKQVAKLLRIKLETCIEASDKLAQNKAKENTYVDLMSIFHGRGFPMKTVKACADRWKVMAPGIIRRDPFALLVARIPGCGFARVDSLYLSLSLNPARLKRQMICLLHHLSSGGSGDTWHTLQFGIDGLQRMISSVDANPKKAILFGRRVGWIATRRDDQGSLWLADGRSARDEATVANKIVSLFASRAAWPSINASSLSGHQVEEIVKATAGPVGILSGTPGTGKTYSLAAIVRACQREFGVESVAVLTPTGKASIRATESLRAQGLSEIEATTIHRVLKPMQSGHGTNEWGFRHNEKDPLPYRAIFVDETSMVDVSLMASLLLATADGTLVLFIGDPYQLPPVGGGAPFRDLINTDLPHGHLTEVRRNSGLIVDNCRAIREGGRLLSCERFDDSGNNLRFVPTLSPGSVVTEIGKVFEAIKRKGSRDPIEDLQVIVPMNDAGSSSRTKLNPILQASLNPNGRQAIANPFRVDDKIICTGNGWYPTPASNVTGFLANGDIGRVIDVDMNWFVVRFPSVGDRVFKIPMKSEYAKKFELAYAITCHKSQGSEWPVVIILADESASRIASREWWYTAISRAKDRCLVFGKMATVGIQSKKVLLGKRKTFLVELIKDCSKEIATGNSGGVMGCNEKKEPSRLGSVPLLS